MERIDVPYLIVGAGPVGLTAGHLFAKQGRGCLVVERRDGPQRHPAAHVVNARTLEIFRQIGLDMDAILGVASSPDDAGHVNFVTRLGGELIGRLPFERQGDEQLVFTPTPLRNISQHHLEPILADALRTEPTADLRYRAVWEASEQDDDGVTSIVRDLDTDSTIEIRSRYLLAADGAGSRVRKSLDIEMLGPPSLQSFVAIHFAADLRSVVADRPGVLHFVMDPAAGGTFVAHDIDREWVYMVSYDPTEETGDDYDHERCERLIRRAIGDTSEEIEIDVHGAGTWNMSAQLAPSVRDRRIFLVGDAAHRFPPTGGLGLNTGVGDVHGLAWKLGAVEDGWACASIVDSHAAERHPVAAANCEQSTTNAMKMVTLHQALRPDGTPSTEGMQAALADPTRRPTIDEAVEEQATHFDMPGLQLGYRYDEGALARDGDLRPQLDDPRVFEPSAEAGCRLPHGWLPDGRSTLDLIGYDVPTLLTVGDHDEWATAIARVDAPLRHVRLGLDVEAGADWLTTCRLAGRTALLVRPDQHVAWRSDGLDQPGPARLADAVDRILG